MKIIAVVAAAALTLLTGGQTQDWADSDDRGFSADFEQSRALCRSVRGREPPRADRPSAAQSEALRGCDSEALYYGIGQPADPVRARHCAFIEAERDEGGGYFSGRAMLMTIYANGVGARRDLDVAMHLACNVEGAPMEVHGRVTHLAELKAQGWTGTDFSICDDATSGLLGGHCAGHEARISAPRREAAMARLAAGWTPAERQALAALLRSHQAYVDAHSDGEVDLSGTLRAAMQYGAEERLKDELLDMLTRLSRGRAPTFGRAQFQAADAELNAAYREVMRGEFYESPGAVTREGIRDAQRAWLRYRDAFLAFAAVKFPGVRRDSLAAWLTQQRTRLLREPE